MDRIVLDINEAYYTAYRRCHNREMWDEDQYAIIEEAEKLAGKKIKKLKEALEEIANGHLQELVSEAIARQVLKEIG